MQGRLHEALQAVPLCPGWKRVPGIEWQEALNFSFCDQFPAELSFCYPAPFGYGEIHPSYVSPRTSALLPHFIQKYLGKCLVKS